jgi:hypothetical protein
MRPNPRPMLLSLLLLLALPVAALAQDAAKPSAQQIVDEMTSRQSALGFDTGQAQLTLTIKDRAGDTRVRKLDVRSKKGEAGQRTLVRLLEPAEVKGQTFLFSQNKSGEDDIWMFVPAFKVTRRVEGSQKKGAFLGSHISFSDLESRDVTASSSVRLPDEVINKDEVFVVESTPKDASSSDYGKVITYVRKKDYIPLKVKFFAKDGKEELKTLFAQRLDTGANGKVYIKQMTIHAKQGGSTMIVLDSLDEAAELPDAIFSKDQLGK